MKPGNNNRYLTIDGLRGIAAMLVVFFHLYGNLKESVSGWLPNFVGTVIAHGYLGVNIFFVISGFVIALSLSDKKIGLNFVGRFFLRRSLRLDPTYWLNIALAILLIYITGFLFPDLGHRALPSVGETVAHLFYAQNLLGYGNIVAVYWTLCLEIQFYIFFIVLLALLQYATGATSDASLAKTRIFKIVFGSTGLLSLASNFHIGPDLVTRGLFLPFWYEFFLGVIVFWTIKGLLKRSYFMTYLVIVLLPSVFYIDKNALACLACTAFLFMAGDRMKLSTYFSSAAYQYLGRISYSLYLFHPIIGWRVISIGKRFLGTQLGVVEGTMLFLAGIAASILSAHIAYVAVERPTHRLSRLIKPVAQKIPQNAALGTSSND